MIQASTCVVLLQGTKIYFQYADHKKGWECPGGKVEEGELPIVAAKREVMEETGIEVEELEHCGVIKGKDPYNNTDYFCHVYYSRTFKGEPTPKEVNLSRGSWFPIIALPKHMAYGIEPINKFLRKKIYEDLVVET